MTRQKISPGEVTRRGTSLIPLIAVSPPHYNAERDCNHHNRHHDGRTCAEAVVPATNIAIGIAHRRPSRDPRGIPQRQPPISVLVPLFENRQPRRLAKFKRGLS
jgi:hypothetical protein